ncbi:hypothetical protein PLUTE_a2589 [Pseudoalteromonas luteoviolacea DSM 6061]|nr:hypothetical protein [Pseudoalteromonas luteoviolacea DSM 6061]
MEYEASFWAYQIKRGKNTREAIYDTINSRPLSERDTLKAKFEKYLGLMLV